MITLKAERTGTIPRRAKLSASRFGRMRSKKAYATDIPGIHHQEGREFTRAVAI